MSRPGHAFECLRALRAEPRNLGLLLESLPIQDAKPGSFKDVRVNLNLQPAKEVWQCMGSCTPHSPYQMLGPSLSQKQKVTERAFLNLQPPTPTSSLLGA